MQRTPSPRTIIIMAPRSSSGDELCGMTLVFLGLGHSNFLCSGCGAGAGSCARAGMQISKAMIRVRKRNLLQSEITFLLFADAYSGFSCLPGTLRRYVVLLESLATAIYA